MSRTRSASGPGRSPALCGSPMPAQLMTTSMPPRRCCGLADGGVDGGLVGDVAGDDVLAGGEVEADDAGAAGAQRGRGRRADAAGGAGDDDAGCGVGLGHNLRKCNLQWCRLNVRPDDRPAPHPDDRRRPARAAHRHDAATSSRSRASTRSRSTPWRAGRASRGPSSTTTSPRSARCWRPRWTARPRGRWASSWPACRRPGSAERSELLLRRLEAYLEVVRADPVTWRLVLMPPEGAPLSLRDRITAGRRAIVSELADVLRPDVEPRGRVARPRADGAHALGAGRRGRPAGADRPGAATRSSA